MTDLLKKLVPAASLALFAGLAFAAPNVTTSQGTAAYGSADSVSQADPAPDCKKTPTDPRCKDK
jgi:hypothetical protein